MEKVVICKDGEVCGELTVQRQGLYLACRAVCAPGSCRVPMRLAAVGERGELHLGIPQPENGRFVLVRQLPAKEFLQIGTLLRGQLRLPGETDCRWEKTETPEEVTRDEHLRELLRCAKGALVCRSGNCRMLALPFASDRPFPLTELFTLARITCIDGREFAAFLFDGSGCPVFP